MISTARCMTGCFLNHPGNLLDTAAIAIAKFPTQLIIPSAMIQVNHPIQKRNLDVDVR